MARQEVGEIASKEEARMAIEAMINNLVAEATPGRLEAITDCKSIPDALKHRLLTFDTQGKVLGLRPGNQEAILEILGMMQKYTETQFFSQQQPEGMGGLQPAEIGVDLKTNTQALELAQKELELYQTDGVLDGQNLDRQAAFALILDLEGQGILPPTTAKSLRDAYERRSVMGGQPWSQAIKNILTQIRQARENNFQQAGPAEVVVA